MAETTNAQAFLGVYDAVLTEIGFGTCCPPGRARELVRRTLRRSDLTVLRVERTNDEGKTVFHGIPDDYRLTDVIRFEDDTCVVGTNIEQVALEEVTA